MSNQKNIFIDKLNKKLKSKYYKSLATYITISLISFVLSALLVIFNLFAIRFNPGVGSNDPELKIELWLFIAIVILTSLSSFITAIMTSLTFKQKATLKKQKINNINIEIDKFNNKVGDYKLIKDREENLINAVTNIINQ